MSKRLVLEFCAVLVLLGGLYVPELAQDMDVKALPPAVPRKVDFAQDIRPIFQERCYGCHGPGQQMSGLRLDQKTAALAGGYSGPVIKPGDGAGSKLIQLVSGLRRDLVMPMGGPRLTPEQVGLLRAWIDQGASWPDQTSTSQPNGVANSSSQVASSWQPTSKHWAFIPPKQPSVPAVQNQSWVRNSIDAFVLAKLESEQIQPSPEASRQTLIRRLSLDLIGLPPTPEETAEFLADKRPDAYDRLVDRLLASPHYGEKWARQWLDLAHYADSDGYEKDWVRPSAWRWRDWVIDALSHNMPFDQFTIEQIAGDELPDATSSQKIATGFFRNTLTNREGGVDPEEYRVEQVIDRAMTFGTTWLALTVGCARCHDHKYDPISQKEFYQLTAFFNTARESNITVPSYGELGAYLQRKVEYRQKRHALLTQYKFADAYRSFEGKSLAALANPGADTIFDAVVSNLRVAEDDGEEILRLPPSQRTEQQQDTLEDFFIRFFLVFAGVPKYQELKFDEFNRKLDELELEYPALTKAQVLEQNPHPPKTHILIRGDFRQPGIELEPGTLAVLNPLPQRPTPSRLTLATWVISKDNPLTSRVWVNRAWQEFFGHGIVETSGDFGTRGDPPTHPELLDWLATEFMRSGWNMKAMHKLIVESATYRQSSNGRPELRARDPENKLLARQARLRLNAELIRDSALAASGLLNDEVGGRSIEPPQPLGVVDLGFHFGPAKWVGSKGRDNYKRGLYIEFLRTTPYPLLANFDAPDAMLSCPRRERSTTPLQALNLLNDPIFLQSAQVLAIRVLREERGTWNDRLDRLFLLGLARIPTPAERDRLARLYEKQRELLSAKPALRTELFDAGGLEAVDANEAALWTGLSRVLLNLDEFITRN